ncbi:MAG: GAF domain-containing protein [Armatimonadetes bacterium]|nr:GAF domain-containing protein [Armatimonadota bacterium]
MAAEALRARIGEPVTWRGVQETLDAVRDQIFEKGQPAHQNRATLFRFVNWCWVMPHCLDPERTLWRLLKPTGKAWKPWTWRWSCAEYRWPWSGWLVPVARSGHLTQKTKTRFLAPDDGQAEGVAGYAWTTKETVTICNLPDLNDESRIDDNAVETYAAQTHTSVDWVRARRAQKGNFARSLVGIPVLVKQKPWGVIVVDSDRDDITHRGHLNSLARPAAQILSALLEGV